jgi:hypothetical protein
MRLPVSATVEMHGIQKRWSSVLIGLDSKALPLENSNLGKNCTHYE